MSLRWRLGMYLGVASHSGEHLIGTWSGDVARTRSIVRVVESAHWSAELGHRIKGTPALPMPSGNDAYERVEKSEDPHAMAIFKSTNDSIPRMSFITSVESMRRQIRKVSSMP